MHSKRTLMLVPAAIFAVVLGVHATHRDGPRRRIDRAPGPALIASEPVAATAGPLLARPAAPPMTVAGRKRVATRQRAKAPAAVAAVKPRSTALRDRFREEMESTSRALEGEGNVENRDAFDRWFYGQRAYPAVEIPEGAIANALAQTAAANGRLDGRPDDSPPPGTPPQPTWNALGPATIPNGQTDTSVGPGTAVSGRLTAVAVHPTLPDVVYVGGAQGGVWKTTNATAASPTWTPLTDRQASLAMGAIAVDPVDPNIVYAGTGEPNGSCDSYYGQGVLRSADGGTTWTLLTGGGGSVLGNTGPFVGKTVAKIIIDPSTAGSTTSTTLWAATTSGFYTSGTFATCSTTSGAARGVWKSTDSGATWTLQTAGSGAQSIKDMAIDPTNHDVLYAAVLANGVWKSTNAFSGAPATYTRLATGFPNNATVSPTWGRISLTIGGSGAPGTLYAAISSSGSILWGVYKTTNGGTNWSHLDNGFNGTANVSGTSVTWVSGPTFVTGSAWVNRRIILNNNVSATIASVTSSTALVLKASAPAASGATFSVGTYPTYCDGQCFYDMTIAADPSDAAANTVYVGGNPNSGFASDLSGLGPSLSHSIWRSDDGGATWRSVSQGDAANGGVHGDDHVIEFDRTAATYPRPVFNGNDGGIWRTANKGASWTTLNTNIAITQFSGVATHPSNPNIVLGGTQDNGTNLLNSALQTPPAWFHADFGDGGQAVIDQGNPNRMLHTYFNQAFNFMGPSKSTTGGSGGPGTWAFVGSYYGAAGQYYNGINATDPVSFYAPLTSHPAFTPNVVYFGTNKVYRSADPQSPCCPTVSTSGCGFPAVVCTLPASWKAVSPSLVKAGNNYLSWIAALPNLLGGKEVVYTGSSDGRVEVSSTVEAVATPTWTVLDKAPLPNRAVTSIAVSPADATGNTAYVAFSGFNGNTPTTPGHVFKTANGLSTGTWTDISGDLPDVPVNAIALEPASPERVYVGTDVGVYRTLNGGAHWSYLSQGFPVVTVFGLERNASTGQIVAATHGRGMFALNSSDVTPPVCGGTAVTPAQFNGTATESAPNDTGVVSIVLQPGSTNLTLTSVNLTNPTSATYVVNTVTCAAGSGTVVATDANGNTCSQVISLPGVPSSTVTTGASTCANSTLNPASVPDAGPGATYAWTITGGTITGGAGTRSITYTAGASGSVVLGVTVTAAGGCASVGGATVTINTACVVNGYFTVAPCRVVDTRNATGTYGGPALADAASRTFVLTGQCNIPVGATAVSANLAVTNQTNGPGVLTVYSGGASRPLASTMNYNPGQTRANNAIIRLGPSGDVTVFVSQGAGTVDWILDVNGYFQ